MKHTPPFSYYEKHICGPGDNRNVLHNNGKEHTKTNRKPKNLVHIFARTVNQSDCM